MIIAQPGPFDDTECRKQGCLWEPSDKVDGTPFCILNPAVHGYTLDGVVKPTSDGLQASLKIKPQTKSLAWHKGHVEELKLSAQYLTDKIVRVKLTDSFNARYEVPAQKYFNIPAKPTGSSGTAKYEVQLTGDFNLTISRKDSKTKL